MHQMDAWHTERPRSINIMLCPQATGMRGHSSNECEFRGVMRSIHLMRFDAIFKWPLFGMALPCPSWHASLITHHPLTAAVAKMRVCARIEAAGSAIQCCLFCASLARATAATFARTTFELCLEPMHG